MNSAKPYVNILFNGSRSVFVAAVVTRSATAVIDAITAKMGVTWNIIIFFVYALFIAHLTGVLIAAYVPTNAKLFGFFFRIALENAGFAWKETLTLIILKWLYADNVGNIIASWISILILVILLVVGSTYVRTNLLQPPEAIAQRLQEFDSEVFALGIAFTFTLIITSIVYSNGSTNILTNTDDSPSTSTLDRSQEWAFLVYVLLLTSVVAFFQICDVGARFSKSILLTQIETHPSEHLSMHYARMPNNSDVVDNEKSTCPLDPSNNSISSQKSMNNCGSGDVVDCMCQCRPSVGRILKRCASTAQGRQTGAALQQLATTALGYLVGCAWYCWSVLTFQSYFSSLSYAGGVLGLFVYAVSITAAMIFLLRRYTLHSSASEEGGSGALEEGEGEGIVLSRKAQFLLACGRLSVGWAWSEWITVSLGFFIPNVTVTDLWLNAAMKVGTAVVVLCCAALYELYVVHSRDNAVMTADISSNQLHGNLIQSATSSDAFRSSL